MRNVSSATIRPLDITQARVAGILLLALAAAFVYWPTSASLIELWGLPGGRYQGTGYVVLLVWAWAIWRRRAELAAATLDPSFGAAIALLGLACFWLLTYRASFEIGHQVVLPVILWAAVYAVFGRQIAALCLFPFFVLYVAIPIWDLVDRPLQIATVHAAGRLVSAAGVAVAWQGDFVHIPEGVFHVEGGCAGVAYLIAAVLVAAVLGELHRESLKTRLSLLAIGAGLSMIGNWIRVATVVLAGHFTDMQSYLVRVSHKGFGWALFAALMVLFIWIAGRISSRAHAPAPAISAASARGAAFRRMSLGTGAALICLAAIPIAATAFAQRKAPLPSTFLARQTGEWTGPEVASDSWRPYFPGADMQQVGTYSSAAGKVDVYVAAYAEQTQSHKMLGYFNSPLGQTAPPWQSDKSTSVSEPPMIQVEYDAARSSRTNGSGRRLVWYAYQVGEKTFVSAVRAQIRYAADSLLGTPLSRVIVLHASCQNSCGNARALLAAFVRANGWLFASPPMEASTAYKPPSR